MKSISLLNQVKILILTIIFSFGILPIQEQINSESKESIQLTQKAAKSTVKEFINILESHQSIEPALDLLFTSDLNERLRLEPFACKENGLNSFSMFDPHTEDLIPLSPELTKSVNLETIRRYYIACFDLSYLLNVYLFSNSMEKIDRYAETEKSQFLFPKEVVKILLRSSVVKAQLLDSVSNQDDEETNVEVKNLAELEDTLEIIEQAVIKARECVNLRTSKQIAQYKKNIDSFSKQGGELKEESVKFDEDYRFIPKGTQLIRVETPPFFNVVLAKENEGWKIVSVTTEFPEL